MKIICFSVLDEIHSRQSTLSTNHTKNPSEFIAFSRSFVNLGSNFCFINLNCFCVAEIWSNFLCIIVGSYMTCYSQSSTNIAFKRSTKNRGSYITPFCESQNLVHFSDWNIHADTTCVRILCQKAVRTYPDIV